MSVATAQAPDPKHNVKNAREAYYEKIGKYDMAPLWEVLKGLVTKEPKSQCVPALWKFKDAKQLVLEAGEVITVSDQTNAANTMTGTITSYSPATGALVLNITSDTGDGAATSGNWSFAEARFSPRCAREDVPGRTRFRTEDGVLSL